MKNAVISSTGLWTPPYSISNEELVASYNAWADLWNREREADIAAGGLRLWLDLITLKAHIANIGDPRRGGGDEANLGLIDIQRAGEQDRFIEREIGARDEKLCALVHDGDEDLHEGELVHRDSSV